MKNILTILALAVACLGLASVSNAASPNPVLDDYVAVSEAVVKDDLPGAKKAAATLEETANKAEGTAMADQAAKIASRSSLDSARKYFKAVSKEPSLPVASFSASRYI